jgi:hypothetical protein
MPDPTPVFPAHRFEEAGATGQEIDTLASEFEHSDLAVQQSMSDFLAGVATGDLREYLDTLRSSGHFDKEDPEEETDEPEAIDEPEPLAPVSDADSDRGAPAVAGDLDVPAPESEEPAPTA